MRRLYGVLLWAAEVRFSLYPRLQILRYEGGYHDTDPLYLGIMDQAIITDEEGMMEGVVASKIDRNAGFEVASVWLSLHDWIIHL